MQLFTVVITLCFLANMAVEALNITILTYVISSGPNPNILGYIAPAIQLGVRELTQSNEYNVTHVILTNPGIATCDDELMHSDMVSDFYYTRCDRTSLFVIIFSGCDSILTLSRLSREWNTLIITSGANFPEMRNKLLHPTAVLMTVVNFKIFRQALMSVFSKYSWTTVAMIYDTFLPFHQLLMNEIQSYLVGLSADIVLHTFPVSTNKSISHASILEQSRIVSRVLGIHASEVRIFMITAAKLGMTDQNYVFLVLEPFPSVRRYGNLLAILNDGSDKVVLDAYHHLFQMSTCNRDDNSDRVKTIFQQIKETGIRDYNAAYWPNEQPNELQLLTYLSVKVFAEVLKETYHSTDSVFDTVPMAKRFRNRTFSFDIGSVYLDDTAEHLPDYCFKRLSQNRKSFYDVLQFDASSRTLRLIPNVVVKWDTPTGTAPPNVPVCGYLGTDGPCRSGTVIYYVTIPCVILALLFLSVPTFWYFKKTAALLDEWWRVDENELQKINATKSFFQKKGLQSLSTIDPERLSKEVFILRGIPTHTSKLKIKDTFSPNKAARIALFQIRLIEHANIVRFLGLCTGTGTLTILSEFCEKGDLFNALEKLQLHWNDRVSLLGDLIEGLYAIHTSYFKHHGYISPHNLYVNKRLTLQIGKCGAFEIIRDVQLNQTPGSEKHTCESLSCWTAPELRKFLPHVKNISIMARYAGPDADIYSLGAVISYMKDDSDFQGSTISTGKDSLSVLGRRCLADDPSERPSITQVRRKFRENYSVSKGLAQNLISRMESYAEKLEIAVAERTKALLEERRVCEDLLAEMMPRSVLSELLCGCKTDPEKFECVTVLFSYINGFVDFVLRCSDMPDHVVEFLNQVFTSFDRLLINRDVYKVETISDTYMIASGLPTLNGNRHASEICELSLELLRSFDMLPQLLEPKLLIAVGVNSGPCCAGIVGIKRPRYCLFGDTVNMASRLASQGLPSMVQISHRTALLIKDHKILEATKRGIIHIKGKGEEVTYWLASQLN